MTTIDKIEVRVSNYQFACFLESLLAEHGITAWAKGISLDSGWRDLSFKNVELPDEAHYIPKEIEVNLPEILQSSSDDKSQEVPK